MSKKILTLTGLVLIFASITMANDTPVVVSQGDTLHPVNETPIEIERELLSINYNETKHWWDVKVDFVFHNLVSTIILHPVSPKAQKKNVELLLKYEQKKQALFRPLLTDVNSFRRRPPPTSFLPFRSGRITGVPSGGLQ